MTYDDAMKHKQLLENHVEESGKALRAYPRGPMGLVPDATKASDTYQRDKRAYDHAFRALRAFNTWFLATYEREYRAERSARRGV
jgi:hypothetical protein